MPRHDALSPHLLGLPRIGEVTHMCPECGNPPRAFCPVCLGVGQVTTERLAQYQRELDAAAATGLA